MPDKRGVTFYDKQSRNREAKDIELTFFPQGSGAVVNDNNIGNGATIERTDVGKFTVTFDKPFNAVIVKNPDVMHETLVLHARVISKQTDSVTGACTGFTFQVYTSAVSATAADVAAAATSAITIKATGLNTVYS